MAKTPTSEDPAALDEMWNYELERRRGRSSHEEAVQEARATRDWPWYFELHKGGEAGAFLALRDDELTDAEFWKWLGHAHVERWRRDPDSPGEDRLVSLMSSSTRPQRDQLMTPEEQTELARHPDTLTIWHGKGRDTPATWCWTFDPEVATRHAIGRRGPGCLLTGTGTKADVVALFTRAGEAEVVIDPARISDMREVPITPPFPV